jgi:hypothetical protein
VSFEVVIFYGIDPVLDEIGQIRLWYYDLVYAIGLLDLHLWVWLKRERLGFGGRDVAENSLPFAAGVLLGGRIFDVALSTSIVSLVDSRLPLLALYSGLDAAGVRQGHVVELIEASSVVLYSQCAVYPALDADARDVFEAYGFDVLSLPPAA